MKTFKLAVVALVAVLLLGGCGLVNRFIPDQQVDLLGLDDTIPLTPGGTIPAGGVTAQAITYATPGGGFSGGTFEDVDTTDIPDYVNPSAIEEDVVLGATITGYTAGNAPTAITVTGAAFEATIDDEGEPASPVTLSTQRTDLNHAYDLVGSCTNGACTYQLASGSEAALFTLSVTGATLDDLWAMVTNTVGPNTVDGSFSLTLAEDFQFDYIEVHIITKNGVIKFG